eukprot:2087896-Pleurochrysis_carterae.AAC.1
MALHSNHPIPTRLTVYLRVWCEGEVESVADGTSDKKFERARTLLPVQLNLSGRQTQSVTSLRVHVSDHPSPCKMEQGRAKRVAVGSMRA